MNIACFYRSVKSRFDFVSLGASLKQEGFKMDKVEIRKSNRTAIVVYVMRLRMFKHSLKRLGGCYIINLRAVCKWKETIGNDND